MTIDVESVESVVVDGAVFCARWRALLHFEIGKSFPGMRKDDDGVYDLLVLETVVESEDSRREGRTRVNAAVPRDGKRINAKTKRRKDTHTYYSYTFLTHSSSLSF